MLTALVTGISGGMGPPMSKVVTNVNPALATDSDTDCALGTIPYLLKAILKCLNFRL
jgi:hypothetical protein